MGRLPSRRHAAGKSAAQSGVQPIAPSGSPRDLRIRVLPNGDFTVTGVKNGFRIDDPLGRDFPLYLVFFNEFGHGGAYGTQAWIDPVKGVAYVLMTQRANFPNADNSDVRKAFQEAAARAIGQ